MTAKIITFFTEKGGSGKTTSSIEVAGTLGLRNKKTLLVDLDEQGSATRCVAQADDNNPFPATLINLALMGGKAYREIRNHIDNYDFIIIDCPPSVNNPAPSGAMLISDLVIIPVIPSPTDLWASVASVELAKRAQATNEELKIAILPNMVQLNTSLARQALGILNEDPEVPVLKSHLGTRTAYRESLGFGTTVHNIPKAQKAIAEIDALVDEILSLL